MGAALPPWRQWQWRTMLVCYYYRCMLSFATRSAQSPGLPHVQCVNSPPPLLLIGAAVSNNGRHTAVISRLTSHVTDLRVRVSGVKHTHVYTRSSPNLMMQSQWRRHLLLITIETERARNTALSAGISDPPKCQVRLKLS